MHPRALARGQYDCHHFHPAVSFAVDLPMGKKIAAPAPKGKGGIVTFRRRKIRAPVPNRLRESDYFFRLDACRGRVRGKLCGAASSSARKACSGAGEPTTLTSFS